MALIPSIFSGRRSNVFDPFSLDISHIHASKNGVLTVTVPKMEEKKPEIKSIDISG
uniref:SHSP domain-containing protein n=1 Tax=Cucumis sativus TaxID=3659 RepID=A0A0A0KLT1_CUCSA